MFEKIVGQVKYWQAWWSDNKPIAWVWEHVQTEGGGHTMFVMLRYGGRGTKKVIPLPVENFQQCSEKQKAIIRQGLEAAGFELVLILKEE